MEVLLQSVLLALGLIASLSLFLSLKRELYTLGRKQRKEMEEARAASFPSAARSGLTPVRRLQAIGLLGQGENAAQIAAALGVPCQEVELLIRVQRLMVEHTPPTATRAIQS